MELRIKEILKAKGITQKTLAEKLDITAIGLSKIINGNPTLETLRKIADVLDIEVKDLFNTPAKENDLFILKDGQYIPIGKVDITKLEQLLHKK